MASFVAKFIFTGCNTRLNSCEPDADVAKCQK